MMFHTRIVADDLDGRLDSGFYEPSRYMKEVAVTRSQIPKRAAWLIFRIGNVDYIRNCATRDIRGSWAGRANDPLRRYRWFVS